MGFHPHETPHLRALLLAASVVTLSLFQGEGVLASYQLDEEGAKQWRLHRRLVEISGLAMTPDDRLFAHGDEWGIIYEIDYRGLTLVKAWGMQEDVVGGDDVVHDDLEGIAVVGDRFYLVNSNGRLYETTEGDDAEPVLYNSYGTGVGRQCEVEGLAYEPADSTLLLLCKAPRAKDLEDAITIFKWSIADREIVGSPISVPLENVTNRIGGKRFRASGIERHPDSGTYVIIAAQQAAIVEIDRTGRVLGARKLDGKLHRQAEGITFDSDGALFISDEGGNHRARLTMYDPTH